MTESTADSPATAVAATFTMDLSRHCPSVEPIEGPFNFDGCEFSPMQLGIAGEAIDAGVFNQDEFERHCWDKWVAAHPCAEQCLTQGPDGKALRGPGNLAETQELRKELEAKLSGAPRGAWGLIRHEWRNDDRRGVTWEGFISDGSGRVHERRLDGRHGQPGYDQLEKAMVGMEIYLARRAEEARREAARSRKMIRDYGWRAGVKLKNATIGLRTFSTVLIERVLENGRLVVRCTQRGSSRRWGGAVHAQSIQLAEGPTHLPAHGQLIITPG